MWLILVYGVLNRIQRFEDTMNQMPVYTAGRKAWWFHNLSARFRESVERTNAAFRDAGVRQNQRPDYLTMTGNILSPEGWQGSLPPLPWRLAYINCRHLSNINEYNSFVRAVDGGDKTSAQYKQRFVCGGHFL